MKSASLVHLHAFVLVARHRSFSAAARELGLTPSAVSQSVRQLEAQLGVPLLARTTRSVALTEAGRRLLDSGGPAVDQALSGLASAAAEPGEAAGRLRINVPRTAASLIIPAIVARFREHHPRVELEIAVEDRMADIVAEGFDAGVRLVESIERDMVHVRICGPFRFVVVGAPDYLQARGVPTRPEDLARHTCITFRSPTSGSLYAWELERGRRTWRIPVGAEVVANDGALRVALALRGVGLAYVPEPGVAEHVAAGRLSLVLEPYAPRVPGFYVYYPSQARRSEALGLFLDAARELMQEGAEPRSDPPSSAQAPLDPMMEVRVDSAPRLSVGR